MKMFQCNNCNVKKESTKVIAKCKCCGSTKVIEMSELETIKYKRVLSSKKSNLIF